MNKSKNRPSERRVITDPIAVALENKYPGLLPAESLDPRANIMYGLECGKSAFAIFGVKTAKIIINDKVIEAVMLTTGQARALLEDLPHFIAELEGRNG